MDDPLYGAVSVGQRFPGVEHWLALFYEHLDRLGDYTGDAPFVFDDQTLEAFADRQAQIKDYYEARENARTDKKLAVAGAPYKPVPPEQLYEVAGHPYRLSEAQAIQLSAFTHPDETRTEDAGGRLGHNFAAERQAADTNLFEAVVSRSRTPARRSGTA